MTGAAEATPGVASAASVTSSALSASAMTTAGFPEPPGKCLLSVAWAETEGASFTKISSSGTPWDFRVGANAAQATSRTAQESHTLRGDPSTRAATRRQIPCPPVASSTGRGLAGQYAARPHSTSTAGRKVIVLSTAQTMPIAPTGPSARLFVRSLSSSASSPSATVAALATMAPKERRRAARAAVVRSPWTASSSRKRAVSRSA